MNYESILIGFVTFLIIGIFHPIVSKGEYYFSKNIWPIFVIAAIILFYFALRIQNMVVSPILSITGFTCLWSVKELFEQEERVLKGHAPKNPARTYKK